MVYLNINNIHNRENKMEQKFIDMAKDFVENEKQFHLGFLPTEQSNPLTKTLEKDFRSDPVQGVRTLQKCDRNVLEMLKKVFASKEFALLADTIYSTVTSGKRVIFSGCGATGRLSILIECMWKKFCTENPALASYAKNVESIMTGGDFALIRSVEFFEDYHAFGARQVRETCMEEGDTLVAITEGGETSSVLGSIAQALENGCKVFLLFNNPADLLADNLERSRAAIRDSRVTVLDLYCGPMALAGSTRMQATTSEQYVAGAALEMTACRLAGSEKMDYAKEFEKLISVLEDSASVLASYAEFEAGIYRKKGYVTYFADDYLLDIFTDTTERAPTFMIPPFRKCDDKVSPLPWAFVKNPLLTTEEVWAKGMNRPLRCLSWDTALLEEMGAPANIAKNPPAITASEMVKIRVGKEDMAERYEGVLSAAVLVTVGKNVPAELKKAFDGICASFNECTVLSIGGTQGERIIPYEIPSSPFTLLGHMAIKLVLNTISTGTMVLLGRVAGNWMSWVDCTNKKLLDRGTRLVCELSSLDYSTSCAMIFEALHEINSRTVTKGFEKPSAVQIVLEKLKNQKA